MGEFLGIGVAAGIWFLHSRFLGEPGNLGEKLLLLLIMIGAGIIEGLVTGSFQWAVLHKRFIEMKARNWLLFTALGAAAGWLLGMIPSVFFLPDTSNSSALSAEPSGLLFALLAVLSGVVLGALFGAFQWLELKKHTPDAARWILANLLGWMVGLALIFLGASLPPARAGLALIVLIGGASGLLAGLSVGAITGLFLVKFRYA